MQRPVEEAVPGSPDPDSAGRDQAPSQLEELADFMEQVWRFRSPASTAFFPLQPNIFKI